jgi:hypothetical protein
VGSIVNTGEASFLMLNAVKSDDPAWAARLSLQDWPKSLQL